MNRTTKHVVMFSTGMSSAILADIVIKEHGHNDTILFFTDTKWEDEDNYRFMNEVSQYFGKEITTVADGRTPEDVFFKERLMKTQWTAPCSKVLKMRQTVIFVENLRLQGYEPTLYFGIGYHEQQRAPRIAENYSHNCLEPVECRFPLIDKELTKGDMTHIVQQEWGIKRPRMYDLGFDHANCGGRCVKAGMGHYRNLYRVWPERYKQQEDMERRFMQEVNDYSLLRRKGQPFTLEQLRHEMESQVTLDLDVEEMPCECVF